MSISNYEEITLTELRSLIITQVNLSPGIKTTELIPNVYKEAYQLDLSVNSAELLKEIENMIKEKELVELNYVLPNMVYREKQMLFPKGTKIIS